MRPHLPRQVLVKVKQPETQQTREHGDASAQVRLSPMGEDTFEIADQRVILPIDPICQTPSPSASPATPINDKTPPPFITGSLLPDVGAEYWVQTSSGSVNLPPFKLSFEPEVIAWLVNKQYLVNFSTGEVCDKSNRKICLLGDGHAGYEEWLRHLGSSVTAPAWIAESIATYSLRLPYVVPRNKALVVMGPDHLPRLVFTQASYFYSGQPRENASPGPHRVPVFQSRSVLNDYRAVTNNLAEVIQNQASQSTILLLNKHPLKNPKGKLPSVAQVQELCRTLSERSDIVHEYISDGCTARAHLVAKACRDADFGVEKLFAIGELGAHNDSLGQVTWHYHVAPLLFVRTDDGVVPMVIDLSIAKEAALPAGTWVDRINRGGSPVALEVAHSRQYFPICEVGNTRERFDTHLPSAERTMQEHRQLMSQLNLMRNATKRIAAPAALAVPEIRTRYTVELVHGDGSTQNIEIVFDQKVIDWLNYFSYRIDINTGCVFDAERAFACSLAPGFTSWSIFRPESLPIPGWLMSGGYEPYTLPMNRVTVTVSDDNTIEVVDLDGTVPYKEALVVALPAKERTR